MMNLDQLKGRLPDYARDQRINLGVITSSAALSPAQAWTIALASAVTTTNQELIAAIETAATAQRDSTVPPTLSPAAIAAAKGAATIMGMNNVYYRFLHFVSDASEYSHMPARLRMQVIGNPGIDKLDFELACLAAAAINGCESCVRSHEAAVRERGGSKAMVQDAVRIAAVIHAVAIALP